MTTTSTTSQEVSSPYAALAHLRAGLREAAATMRGSSESSELWDLVQAQQARLVLTAAVEQDEFLGAVQRVWPITSRRLAAKHLVDAHRRSPDSRPVDCLPHVDPGFLVPSLFERAATVRSSSLLSAVVDLVLQHRAFGATTRSQAEAAFRRGRADPSWAADFAGAVSTYRPICFAFFETVASSSAYKACEPGSMSLAVGTVSSTAVEALRGIHPRAEAQRPSGPDSPTDYVWLRAVVDVVEVLRDGSAPTDYVAKALEHLVPGLTAGEDVLELLRDAPDDTSGGDEVGLFGLLARELRRASYDIAASTIRDALRCRAPKTGG